jgi:hypothetical protein
MSKKFVEADCKIPVVWCGESSAPPTECLRTGFGAGTHTERNSNLPKSSLQQIKYVGEKHEKDFKRAGISSTDELVKQLSKKTTKEMESILKRILVKSDGKLDVRAYNCVILYLYRHGVGGVPACNKIVKSLH